MPIRYKPGKGYRRRRGGPLRRRRKRYAITRKPSLVLSGFPKSKMIRLRYSQEILLNAAIGGLPVVNTFSANGMYDPDTTGGGHQPRGFDEWMAVYQHYTVVGSKANMRWLPTSSSDLVPSAFGITLADTTTFGHTTLGGIVESVEGGTNYRIGGALSNSTSGNAPMVSKTFSAKKFFGTKSIVTKSGFKGTDAANPTEDARFHCWAAGCSTAEPGPLCFQITIDYIAVMSERRGLGAS